MHTQTRDPHSVVFSGPQQQEGSGTRLSGSCCPVTSIPRQSSDWRPLGWESALPACLTWTGPAFAGSIPGGAAQLVSQVLGAEPAGREPGPTPPPARPWPGHWLQSPGAWPSWGWGRLRWPPASLCLPPGAAGPAARLVGLCLGSRAGSCARHGQLTPQEEGPQRPPGPQLLAVRAVGEAARR